MLIQRQKPARPPWKWPANKPKPRLRANQLAHFRVHYKALEEYLETVYKVRDFSFLHASGCTPGMVPEYTVTGALLPSWDSCTRAERLRYGQRADVPFMLNVLCLDGFIPAGKYIIDTQPLTPPIDVYRALLEKHQDPLAKECLLFREKHQNDAEFSKQAAVLDSAVRKWQESLERT